MLKMTIIRTAVIAGVLLLGAAAAQAQDSLYEDVKEGDMGRIGVQLRGGVTGYTGDLGELTGTGALWGVQATAEPRERLGLELAYEGGRTPIDDARLVEDAAIFRNGVQGVAKIYAFERDDLVRPFAGVGVGVSYANPGEGAEALYQNDYFAEIPLSLGVEMNTGMLTAGLRGTYSPMFGESFADTAVAGDNPQGSVLQGALTVGGRF